MSRFMFAIQGTKGRSLTIVGRYLDDCTQRPDSHGFYDVNRGVFRDRMNAVARHQMRKFGTLTDKSLLTVSKIISEFWWLAILLPLTGSRIVLWIVLVAAASTCLPWTFVRIRVAAMRKRLVRDLACLRCQYSLLGATTDIDGFGRCPECNRRFNRSEYREPPLQYQPDARSDFLQEVGRAADVTFSPADLETPCEQIAGDSPPGTQPTD